MRRRLRWLTMAACSAAGGLAAMGLAGWVAGTSRLATLLPGYPAMNPLAAVCLLVLAAAILARDGARVPQWAPRAAAGVVLVVASLRCIPEWAGFDVPVDLLLFRDRPLDHPDIPHRMTAHGASGFACLAAGLLLLDRRTGGVRWSHGLLFAAFAVPFVALVGYVYAAAPMYGFISIPTAMGLLLLSVAAFALRPDQGVCRLLFSRTPGGEIARRLMPAALIVPFVLGWLRLRGQLLGLYGLEIGVALLTLAIVAVIVGLILVTANRIDVAESARERAVHALERSVERQNRILDSPLIGILTVRDGKITAANRTFLDLTGYGAADLPLAWEAITPPELHARSHAAVAQLAERGVTDAFEKEYLRRDGSRVPVLVGAATLPGSEGEVIAFVVDLTGKKAAELEAARTRLFLDSIIENLPHMVFVKDAADLRFVRLNRAGEALLGFDRTALLGKNDYDFFPRDEADFFTAKDLATLAGRDVVDIPEEPIRTGRGETRLLHTKKVPILDPDGVPRYLLGISEDITERRRDEEAIVALNEGLRRRTAELEAANHELESFSYSVSHDLRAPLRHIDGFADLLARHARERLDDKGCRYLDAISTSARNMGRLIDDLLAFSRMSRAAMSEGEVDVDRMVQEVIAGLDGDVGDRPVEWRVAALPVVRADGALLRVVLVNLLANALKYTRGRSPAVIEVGARTASGEDVIHVRDNGVGFDMTYAGKLFGVFQRLHRDDDFEGTGIGLATVRRVIARHGGRVWAEGAVGAGASFFISLPRTDTRGAIQEAA